MAQGAAATLLAATWCSCAAVAAAGCSDLTPITCERHTFQELAPTRPSSGLLVQGRVCSLRVGLQQCQDTLVLVDSGWRASDVALSAKLVEDLALEEQSKSVQHFDSHGSPLTFYAPNVAVHLFFDDDRGHKLDFVDDAGRVSNVSQAVEDHVGDRFAIVGEAIISRMALTIQGDGIGSAVVVKRCPLTLNQKLHRFGMYRETAEELCRPCSSAEEL